MTWRNMIRRCHDKRNASYKYYGGRGIKVCKRWRSFENFLSDVGEKPSGFTLDRIDNDSGYEPGNIRWATTKEQARNKRGNRLITINGETRPLVTWCEIYGRNYGAVLARINKLKWTPEKALKAENRSASFILEEARRKIRAEKSPIPSQS